MYIQLILLLAVGMTLAIFLMNLSVNILQPMQHLEYNSLIQQLKHHQDREAFDAFLLTHPIFKTFNLPVKTKQEKKKVNILVIVSSAPKRSDRRHGIRQTWWKECQNITKVSLSFSLSKY